MTAQPIDTAPKDRAILLFEGDAIYKGRWDDDMKCWAANCGQLVVLTPVPDGWAEIPASGQEASKQAKWDGLNQRSDAWRRVVYLLNDVTPGWKTKRGTSLECALETIETLASSATAAAPPEWSAAIGKALDRALVFDDGSDGADAESASSVVAILSDLLADPRMTGREPLPAPAAATGWHERLIADYQAEYVGQGIESWIRGLPDSIFSSPAAVPMPQGKSEANTAFEAFYGANAEEWEDIGLDRVFHEGFTAGQKFRANAPEAVPKLDVWFGSMPESNGKKNWTAILHKRGDLYDGITLTRSENQELARYDADCFKYLIGQLPEKPCPLDYDVESVAPDPAEPSREQVAAEAYQIIGALADDAVFGSEAVQNALDYFSLISAGEPTDIESILPFHPPERNRIDVGPAQVTIPRPVYDLLKEQVGLWGQVKMFAMLPIQERLRDVCNELERMFNQSSGEAWGSAELPLAPRAVSESGYWVVESKGCTGPGSIDGMAQLFPSKSEAQHIVGELEKNGWSDVKLVPTIAPDPKSEPEVNGKVVFSMNGFRRQLSEGAENLREIGQRIINDDHWEAEDLVESINEIVCHSNLINCTYDKENPDFSDMSHLEVELLETSDEN